MKTTDLGIFLHKTPYSDSSLIVWFYTKKQGLQKYMYRGGKKKAHNLFPMAIDELTYYARNDDKLVNLTNVEGLFPLSFQFDPAKTTIAFFMAETLRKCVHLGDSDEDLFLFIEKQIEKLNSTNELSLFPLKFLIASSKLFGFMPLSEPDGASVFNIEEGIFQQKPNPLERTHQGEGVDLILTILNGKEVGVTTETMREKSLQIMMDFYSIHVPRLDKLESYEIVKEVLRS